MSPSHFIIDSNNNRSILISCPEVEHAKKKFGQDKVFSFLNFQNLENIDYFKITENDPYEFKNLIQITHKIEQLNILGHFFRHIILFNNSLETQQYSHYYLASKNYLLKHLSEEKKMNEII